MSTAAPLLLLAELDHWDALVSRFRGEFSHSGASAIVVSLLVLVIAVVLLGSLAHLVWRQIAEKRANLPHGLFVQLCAVHELNPIERRVLQRAAKALDLSDASLLFVEPQHLSTALVRMADVRDTLSDLRKRLFEHSERRRRETD